MDSKSIMKIFEETAYVRAGGRDSELKAAQYLVGKCAELGLTAAIEPFQVQLADIKKASLTVDGVEIPCKGYFCAGSHELEAPFYYLASRDAWSLSLCRGKIVMVNGYMNYWLYKDILDNGALGFITFDGNVNYADRDIDQRELRSFVSNGVKIPCVNINAKDAMQIVKSQAKTAKIVLEQDEYMGDSRNVILDMPGESEDTIIFSAHYDSTSLSQGAYDNMSGSVGLLGIAEYFTQHPHRCGLRFIWCGSEERGLLGSKAYTAAHEEELKKAVLNVNLDMIGCIMGGFRACVTSEERLMHYISYLGDELGMGVKVNQDVYSSDSTPFADHGVPAVTFARATPPNCGTIHNSYDTVALMSGENMLKDIAFICAFADRMANAKRCPVSRTIPDNMKEKLDIYLNRKRGNR